MTVEKLVYGGDGLARPDGRVVLAPFVLPGERVLAQPEREKPGLIHAKALTVLEPSVHRVNPPCPVFGRCGGCHYQHAAYAHQLAAKRDILAEELRRLGRIELSRDIEVAAAEPYGYRNRVELQVRKEGLGFFEARSHKLCAIDNCPIASPKINQTIDILSRMRRDPKWPPMVRSIELFTDEESVQLHVTETERPVAKRFFEWCAGNIPGLVEGALDYHGQFRVSRGSFFQVNRFLVDTLADIALAGAEGETAFDLYAGVGLFVPRMAQRFDTVTAVESGSAAVRDLRFNADRAGLGNVRAEARLVEEFLQGQSEPPDFILLDPPRAGLGRAVAGRLAQLRPRQMVVVSCDPATLARDLGMLMTAGYRLERITMLDLFPQTYHLETIVHLRHALN